MSFLIQKTKLDFGTTEIENIFLNIFMPTANGTFVKVYLMGYKFAKDNDPAISITNKLLSKHLDIPLSDVLDAWDYWEKKEIIEKIKIDSDNQSKDNYGVEFKNLTELYISKNYLNPEKKSNFEEKSEIETSTVSKSNSTIDDLIALSKNKYISDMFKEIDYINRRPLSHSERIKVIDWIKDFNFDTDIIIKAFFISSEKKGKATINYVGGILRNWFDMDITNIEDLNKYLKKNDVRNYNYNIIKESLGANSLNPTLPEKKTIDIWFDKWNFSIDMILEACNRSTNTINPSINYINGILNSWHEKGLKTLEDLKKDVKNKNNDKSDLKVPKKNYSTKFHNFENTSLNYSKNEINDIIAKIKSKDKS